MCHEIAGDGGTLPVVTHVVGEGKSFSNCDKCKKSV